VISSFVPKQMATRPSFSMAKGPLFNLHSDGKKQQAVTDENNILMMTMHCHGKLQSWLFIINRS
jgi:hypothetical protein